jgi:hypothetical protein
MTKLLERFAFSKPAENKRVETEKLVDIANIAGEVKRILGDKDTVFASGTDKNGNSYNFTICNSYLSNGEVVDALSIYNRTNGEWYILDVASRFILSKRQTSASFGKILKRKFWDEEDLHPDDVSLEEVKTLLEQLKTATVY